MDARQFDALSLSLSTGNTRRRLLGALAALSALGGLAAILDPEDAEGKERRKRRKKRHQQRHQHSKGRSKKQRQGKRACKPQPNSETCAGKCGSVVNNCKRSVACGACTCDPACGVCERCAGATCQACDPCCDAVCCNEAGSVCHAGTGACCVPESKAQTCAGQCATVTNNCGVDVDCGACTCDPACPACQVCDAGSGDCVADPSQQGDACGDPGQVCQADGTCACEAGSCTAPQTCGGGNPGTPGVCGCTPTTCESLDKTCGEWPDGCGGTLQCGGCAGGSRCCDGACVSTWSNQTTFGSYGAGPSEFFGPFGIAVSGNELMAWVADAGHSRIAIWTRPSASSTTWTNLTTFGSDGAGPSQLNLPLGITVSGDELTAWVVDSYNHRISIWTRPNANSTTWSNLTRFGSQGTGPSQFSVPYDIAVSGDELTAWVADTGNNRISIWTRPNASSTTWTNQTTFGSNGGGPSEIYFPSGIVVSGDELTVWVADQGNNRISIWTRPNTSSTTWTNLTTFGSQGAGPSQFGLPYDIAVSGDELTAWVVEYGNHRIAIWTRPNASSTTWTAQTTFGSQGAGPTQFRSPTRVAVSGDELTAWVADKGNNRISIWTLACPA